MTGCNCQHALLQLLILTYYTSLSPQSVYLALSLSFPVHFHPLPFSLLFPFHFFLSMGFFFFFSQQHCVDDFSHVLYLVPSLLSESLFGCNLKAVKGSETTVVAMRLL